MSYVRPDKAKFDQFALPLEVLDEHLKNIASENTFEMVKNLNRLPCRVLQKPGTPFYLIDISYDDYWVEIEFSDNLLLSVMVVAYYKPMESSEFYWEMRRTITSHCLLSQIEINLSRHIEEAMMFMREWTVGYILQHGSRVKNPAFKG